MYKTNVLKDGQQFLVSTVNTTFDGWETMVFPWRNGVLNMTEVYCNRYDTAEEARLGHEDVVNNMHKLNFY